MSSHLRDYTLANQLIYIAGPMRGCKYFNFPAFDAAKEKLIDSGFRVLSPADLDRESGFDAMSLPEDSDWFDINGFGFSMAEAIERDIKSLRECHAIYMLKGWEKSKGAKAEKAMAEWMGLDVMYEEETQADGMSVNAAGGKQSHLGARFDCVPATSLRLLAQCCGFGANKYGKGNWKLIESDDHICHAMNHLNEFNRGDRSEPHLVNALTRVSMALERLVESGDHPVDYHHPDLVK